MGRPPCCDESGVKKGPWTPAEDEKLMAYISKHGEGSWRTLPKHASLNRCGKSCRLRWANYLRPHIRRGKFTEEEERMIVNLHSVLGNKWSKIAAHLPGRTDNEIKNFWNTHIRKKLLQMGIDPETHKPRTDINHLLNLSQLLGISNLGNSMVGPWSNPLISLQLLQNMLQIMNSNSLVNLRNPYLLANQSLNPLDAFLRGTNTLQNEEPILRGQEYLNPRNPGHFSQANGDSSQQDIFKSWTDKESPNPEFLGCNKSSSTSHENQAENLLPALVASYPRTRTRTFNQMESSSKPAMSTQSPASTTFEDWEKFLVDDETGVSYWKEILDLASTSASPISW